MIKTKICIIGAGPGGAAAALKLDRMGIPCLLVDKAVFPRDKVCGDAISGKVVYGLNRIDKALAQAFHEQTEIRVSCWGLKFSFPNKKEIRMHPPQMDKVDITTAKPEGYISKRIHFDNFLIEQVRQSPNVTLKEGVAITKFEKMEAGYLLSDKKGEIQIQTQLVLDASGAQSRFNRLEGNMEKEDKHYAGSVRAYYKNVTGLDQYNSIELHYIKGIIPGYFWIFPLPDGQANVGMGISTHLINKRKLNLKQTFQEVVDNVFKERFQQATQVSPLKGFGLPLGSKKRQLSGDHYMLIGDAAALIDPLTGEGIGNAVISGSYAAIQAAKCLETNNFSADFMKAYDKAVYKKLWRELKISHFLQKMIKYPTLVSILVRFASSNKHFLEVMTMMFSDVDLRKKLRSPRFYFNLIFNR